MLFLTEKKPRHRRRQPRSLYETAIRQSIISLWKLSPLPSLHAESAHSFKNVGTDINNEDYKDYLHKTSEVLKDIAKKLEYAGQVPLRLRMKIMTMVKDIDKDMSEFAFSVASGLDHKTIPNIKYCMEHVAVTENFTIDMTESICNIMLVSKLNVAFTKQFLACYCVNRSKVVKVCEASLKNHKRLHTKLDLEFSMKVFLQLSQDFMTVRAYWKKQRRQDRLNCTRQNLRYASDFQYIAVAGPLDALKYYCFATCEKLEPYEVDEHVYQCAKLIFQADAFCADKIVFFHKTMSSESWKRLLNEEFVNIFLTYLRSWRHRHLCMQLVIDVKDTFNYVIIQSLLREMVSIARDKYQYHEILNIINEFWTLIPDNIKGDIKIAYTIPDLVRPGEDIEDSVVENFLLSLPHFLKDYTEEIQVEILAIIIFNLVSASNESLVESCLKTAQDLGLKSKAGRDYVTKDRFKNFIIRNASISVPTDYEKVSKYISSNEEEENKLKKDFINDKHFIADLLVMINDTLHPFFEWLLKEESKINAFKATLVNDDFINDIYQRRLINFSSFCDANNLFGEAIMNLNQQQVDRIQIRVNTKVLHLVLLNSLGSVCFDREAFFVNLFFTPEEETAFMQEFLYLPQTIAAIYDMILDLENFYASFMCARDGAQLMLQWQRFITNMVKPYLDSNAYEAMLLRDRNMVISLCHEKVKNHPKFRTIFNDSTMRENIDLRLRGFSLLFHNNDLPNKLQKYVSYAVEQNGPFMFQIAMDISSPF